MADSTNEDVEQALINSAAGPKRASGDTGSIEQHSLREQIEADQYLASKTAASKKGLGIRNFKLVPPGGNG